MTIIPSIIRLFNISTTVVIYSHEISKLLPCQEEQLMLKQFLLIVRIYRRTPYTHLSHCKQFCKFRRQKYKKKRKKRKNAHALLPNTHSIGSRTPVSRPRLITIVITAHRGVVFQFCRRPLERSQTERERERERGGEKKISLSRTIIPRFPWDYPNLRRPVGVRSRIREHIS